MKMIFRTLCMLLMVGAEVLFAQPFKVIATSRSQSYMGGQTRFTIKVKAEPGFSATVFLTAHAPTLQGEIWSQVYPPAINYPYTDTAVFTLTLLSRRSAGSHPIVIEGMNGPAISRDTVMLTMTENSGWRTYDRHNSPLRDTMIQAIVVDSSGAGWIGTRQGLLRLSGETWTVFDSTSSFPFPMARIIDLALDSSSHVLAAVWDPWLGNMLATYRDGVWSSRKIPMTAVEHLSVGSKGRLWVSQKDSLGYFDGQTWQVFEVSRGIGLLALDRRGYLWVNGTYRVWVNGGAMVRMYDGQYWTQFTIDGLIAADKQGDIWCLNKEGFWKFDGTFFQFYPIKPQDRFPGIAAQAMDFAPNGDIWIGNRGSDGQGGLAHYNGANSWFYRPENSDLPNEHVSVVRAAPDGSIWIGTQRGGLAIINSTASPDGLYNYPVSAVRNVVEPTEPSALGGIYPNPASDHGIVELTVLRQSHFRLSVLNMVGEEVAVLLDGNMELGVHEVPFNSTGLPAGIYYLRLSSGGRVDVRPVVVAR